MPRREDEGIAAPAGRPVIETSAIAGSKGMIGAAVLTGVSALKCGAGLV